ncbi:MAG: right-handed parallel beta-helix repeat-containing protein [Hellea sp.]|nr:right-handed parallel beta-helix repeat-containing protein [Hellea sp.]
MTHHTIKLSIFLGACTVAFSTSGTALAADNYRDMCTKFVHAASGSGKIASAEQPAKDLGNIISRLEQGDVVCIAEGTYTGRSGRGVDDIEMAVSVIGGFSPDFKSRDPWGAHKTIFTGEHNSKNFETQTRLSIDSTKTATRLMEARGEPTAHTIIVDGLIFDNGPRNYYKTAEQALIIRKGTPTETPTPESGALSISTGVNATVRVRNNVATNFAPTEGVFSLFGGKGAEVTVENNVAVNNTGSGFRIGTSFTGDEVPSYKVNNNVSLFNQKHTAFGTFGGSGIMLESSTKVSANNNVFAYNDNYGVDNTKRTKGLILTGNIIAANANSDYVEFDLDIALEDIDDESDLIDDGSNNLGTAPSFDISEDWSKLYVSRNVIDRNAAEAEVQVVAGWNNDVRSMFGLNLIGTDLNVDSPVWLPRLSLDDALSTARFYGDLAGVKTPAPETY